MLTTHTASRTPAAAERAVGPAAIGGLAVTALVHAIDLPDKMAETPYMGVGYIALIAAAVVGVVLIGRRDHRGLVLAAAASTAAIVAYLLSRSVGLPAAGGDIGNWTEPLGIVALVAEAAVVVSSVAALRRRAVATA